MKQTNLQKAQLRLREKFIKNGKEKERWSGLAQNLLISNEFIFRD